MGMTVYEAPYGNAMNVTTFEQDIGYLISSEWFITGIILLVVISLIFIFFWFAREIRDAK